MSNESSLPKEKENTPISGSEQSAFDSGDFVHDIVWSKGYAQYCDHSGPEQYWAYPTEYLSSRRDFYKDFYNVKGLVWVCLGSHFTQQSDLTHFSKMVNRLAGPTVLITSDGDSSVPGEIPNKNIQTIETTC